MPVEVSLVSQDGIPEDAIFSIRAGTVRRQAAISTGKPYRFPKIGIQESPVKIDILQTIGSAYVVIKPGEERYQAIFHGKGGDEMACEVEIRDVDGHAAPDEPEPKDAGDNAKAYLDKHSILPFVQAVLQTVIKEQPEDPYAHIARHFLCGYDITDHRSPVLTRRRSVASSCMGASTADMHQELGSPKPAVAPAEATIKEEEPAATEAAEAAQEVVEIPPVAAAAEAVEEAADAAVPAPAEEAAVAAAAPAPAEEAPDDLDTLRLQMRHAVEEAQLNGGLLEALQAAMPGPKDEEAEVDALRGMIRESLEEAHDAGTLAAQLEAVRTESKDPDPLDSLRATLRDTLVTAQSDGRLASTLTGVGGAEAT